MEKKNYLILDMKTGIMDGWYKDYTSLENPLDAVGMLEHHQKRDPNGDWVIVELKSKFKPITNMSWRDKMIKIESKKEEKQ